MIGEIIFIAVAPFVFTILGLIIACFSEKKPGAPEVDLSVHVGNGDTPPLPMNEPRLPKPQAPFTEKDLPGGFLASNGLAQGLFDCFIPTGDT